ncbi:hypothetical protein B1H18_15560 [Streptomyces tsukubensis]|uniref:Uncharacterized protein n=1 Tax=Streptomyces tsukubensis TaxID=83656 RepID=A0A1V4A8B1_9ACTN|nr:hypothetical protein B1H18_15560 [Streptomyces tsukubensis]
MMRDAVERGRAARIFEEHAELRRKLRQTLDRARRLRADALEMRFRTQQMRWEAADRRRAVRTRIGAEPPGSS